VVVGRGAEAQVTRERVGEEVRVDLGPRSYPVVIAPGVLAETGARLKAAGFEGRCALVTSERVGALYREPVLESLRAAGLVPSVVEIPDGEEHKNLAWLAVLYDRLLEAGTDRRSPLVALGGGVITDLAGFAAATLLRGLPSVLLPTTLLAQIDAAVGGKTGVNHVLGKNLIGAFHQPRLVLADVDVLATLPRRELLAGVAEVIKTAAIGDAALFAQLEQRLDQVLALEGPLVVALIAACVRYKAGVVAEDEQELQGGRAVLNFGHTVGHAIEALTGYKELLHGEAVAIGMAAAVRVSVGLGRCRSETAERLIGLLKRAGLPTDIPSGLTPAALALAMRSDKKSAGRHIRFVCLEKIGRTAFVELAGEEIVKHL
jgi:3-dehydroquinate synthase